MYFTLVPLFMFFFTLLPFFWAGWLSSIPFIHYNTFLLRGISIVKQWDTKQVPEMFYETITNKVNAGDVLIFAFSIAL
jgi:hypothetical protein